MDTSPSGTVTVRDGTEADLPAMAAIYDHVIATSESMSCDFTASSWWEGSGVSIEALDHVQLAMPAGREAEAIAFYEGLLGIAHVAKPPHLAVRGGCWFEDGPLKVHLGVDADFRPAHKAHPALRVSDLPALLNTLRAAGVRIVDDEPLEGYDRAYVDDPFGNRIELLEPTS